MRLDNLKVLCKREYGTTQEVWESAIADYQFPNARADVDDATAAVIKEACQINTQPVQAKDDRSVQVLAEQIKRLATYVNTQTLRINVLTAQVESFQLEVSTLRANTLNVTEQLIKKVDELETVEPVQVPASLPTKFAAFQDVFG